MKSCFVLGSASIICTEVSAYPRSSAWMRMKFGVSAAARRVASEPFPAPGDAAQTVAETCIASVMVSAATVIGASSFSVLVDFEVTHDSPALRPML